MILWYIRMQKNITVGNYGSHLFLHESFAIGVDPEPEGLGAEVLELGVDEADRPAAFVDGRRRKAAVA